MLYSSLVSERIEIAELIDLHNAATPDIRNRIGLHLENIGSAYLSIAKNEKSILLNRVIGLGVESAESKDTIYEIINFYQKEKVGRFFIHLHPESKPQRLRDWLLEAGLRKGRGWQKFHRTAYTPAEIKTDLTVKEIDKRHAEDHGLIISKCFDLSENCIPLVAALVGRPNWYVFMTFDGDIPSGSGSCYINDKYSWFDFGATLPEFRGRGGQSLMLYQRIKHSIDINCEMMFTTTGEAVEGDPQHSYKNILRAGFKPLYLRENFEFSNI